MRETAPLSVYNLDRLRSLKTCSFGQQQNRNRRHEWFIAAAVLIVVGCGAEPDRRLHVAASQHGETWPFTIAEGRIDCARESQRSARLLVTLEHNGIMYGLNGSAKSFGYPDVASILKPGRVGVDVQPFITMGLRLCEQPGR